METSVTRPGFLHYEEQGGILPMHLFGALFEGRRALGNGAFRYAIAAGGGPELTDNELRPIDVLRPTYGQSDLATTLRLEYVPDEESLSSYALFLSRARIYNDMILNNDVDQRIAGLAANWQGEQLHLLAASFHISNDFDDGSSGAFLYSYLQAEYQWTPRWNTYARALVSRDAVDDPYLAYFPRVYKDQHVAGVRFDFKTNQALKVEIGHIRTVGENYDELCFQWSAAFP